MKTEYISQLDPFPARAVPPIEAAARVFGGLTSGQIAVKPNFSNTLLTG
jgi:hypothetical protein